VGKSQKMAGQKPKKTTQNKPETLILEFLGWDGMVLIKSQINK